MASRPEVTVVGPAKELAPVSTMVPGPVRETAPEPEMAFSAA